MKFDGEYYGVIEDIDDPLKEGRCKIRVFGVFGNTHPDLSNIPTEDLPWAYPYRALQFSKDGSGTYSTPRKGITVKVRFENGNIYEPRYYSINEIDKELKDELKDDYEEFNSIMWDSSNKVKIYFSKKTGVLVEYDESFINLKPDNSILIIHKNNTSSIELAGNNITINSNDSVDVSTPNNITINSNSVHVNGVNTDIGANPIFSNVNGEILMKLILALATGLDAKMPVTSGTFAKMVEDMKPLILSDTVKTSP